MENKFNYAPGPTSVRENVRFSRANETTNPDVDLDFVEFYKNTCDSIKKIINGENAEVYILNGEGILGLEAACATLTEDGDRVLVIDNGIYGKGFDGFVKMYGGEVTYFSSKYDEEINLNDLREFLETYNDFKYATVVHCDTPTGVLNNVKDICTMLKSYGILTVVDSVSAMMGEDLNVSEWNIDIAIGGSQKAISAPPGLTIVSVSEDAMKAIRDRKTEVRSFYCNLNIWSSYYEDKWFPYTMPISDILGLAKAIENIQDEGIENVIRRHRKIAEAVRNSLKEYGIELFLRNGFSNTVTAIKIPEEIGALNLKKHLIKEYSAYFSTSLNEYEDKILRIGHMGENATFEKTLYAMNILGTGLRDLGFEGNGRLGDLFVKWYREK